jgi:MbtH protein
MSRVRCSSAGGRVGGKKARASNVYSMKAHFASERPITMTQQQNQHHAADDLVYTVVINDEEQYSIWPAFREVPAGWREAGKRGAKADCLAYIESAWTDMRPASLRRHMDALNAQAKSRLN